MTLALRKLEYLITIVYIIQILYHWHLIKAYQEFMIFDICITLYVIHDEINGTAHG